MTKSLGRLAAVGVLILAGAAWGAASASIMSMPPSGGGAAAADEEAFKVTTLNAAAGSPLTRLRITGDEDPARAVFENADVGIGVASPAEDLEVSGALRIGAAQAANNGTVRWTGTDFEGRKGGAWVSLTSPGPSGPGGSAVVLFGTFRRNALSSPTYLFPGYGHSTAGTDETRIPVPRVGVIKKMYVVARSNTFPAGTDVTLTLRKNGTDTALAATLPGGGTLLADDLIDTVSVAAGDALSVKSTLVNQQSGELRDVLVSFQFAAE